jgi:hypothetical protein
MVRFRTDALMKWSLNRRHHSKLGVVKVEAATKLQDDFESEVRGSRCCRYEVKYQCERAGRGTDPGDQAWDGDCC